MKPFLIIPALVFAALLPGCTTVETPAPRTTSTTTTESSVVHRPVSATTTESSVTRY